MIPSRITRSSPASQRQSGSKLTFEAGPRSSGKSGGRGGDVRVVLLLEHDVLGDVDELDHSGDVDCVR